MRLFRVTSALLLALLLLIAAKPLYYEREITTADLEGRTLRELSLMRNWIYARVGNPFRRSWLREYFEAFPWYRPLERMDAARLTPLDRRNAETIGRYEIGLTADDLKSRLRLLEEKKARTGDEEIELVLLNERLGTAPGGGIPTTSPLQNPALLDSQLTVPQLNDMSRRDLYFLRNTIYARRGRPFASEALRIHFGRQAWYSPDSTWSESRLTPVERRNALLILSFENELGGPLTDDEAEDAFGFA